MKKRKYYYALLPLLFFTVKVHALSGTPALSCSSEDISLDNNVTCNVAVNITSGGLGGLEANYAVSDNLEVVSFSITNANWQGGVVGNKIGVYAADAFTSNVGIGVFTIKLTSADSQTASISLSDIKLTNEEFSTISYPGTLSKSFNVVTSSGQTDSGNEATPTDDSSSSNTTDTNTNNDSSTSNDTTTTGDTKTDTNKSSKNTNNPDTGAFLPLTIIFILIMINVYVILAIRKKVKFRKI